MTGNTLALLAAYLLGSIPTAVIVGRRVGGTDIRRQGSGNPGATNVLRVLGWKLALAVLIVDLGKGAAAVAWLPILAGPAEWLPFAIGVAAVSGHLWPVWLRMRGGKGVATAAGAASVLTPWACLALLPIFALLSIWSRRVAVASLTCAVALTPAILIAATVEGRVPPRREIAFGVVVGLLVLLAHRDNIARLMSGTEPKLRWRR